MSALPLAEGAANLIDGETSLGSNLRIALIAQRSRLRRVPLNLIKKDRINSFDVSYPARFEVHQFNRPPPADIDAADTRNLTPELFISIKFID